MRPDERAAADLIASIRGARTCEPSGRHDADLILARCASTARSAQSLGLGVNAGHDLSQQNLGYFLRGVPKVLEVSIGHALFGEAIYDGLERTVKFYLALISAS